MTKQEAMRMVRQAKSAHIRWRAFVLSMLAGLEVAEHQAPIHHKACDFGQWFYSDGFRAFAHWPIYQDVEYVHELLHAVYERLYQACSEAHQAEAERLSGQLMGISESLLVTLDLLDEEIFTARDEDF
ncbi:MAG: CZB domain-containing protein [Pseudomonadota bacterium]